MSIYIRQPAVSSSRGKVLDGLAELLDKTLLNVGSFLGLKRCSQYIFRATQERSNLSISDRPTGKKFNINKSIVSEGI